MIHKRKKGSRGGRERLPARGSVLSPEAEVGENGFPPVVLSCHRGFPWSDAIVGLIPWKSTVFEKRSAEGFSVSTMEDL